MLDDDTIEVALGPGTMPGTEITHELPVITAPLLQSIPAHLADDPILTMDAPRATHPSLFDHAFGDRPVFYPARPHKAPRVPVKARDHLLAALGGGVVLLGIATVVLVESGYNSGLPQSEQERLHPRTVATAPADPGISQVPLVPSAAPSPSSIPRHIRQAPPAPASRHIRPLAAPVRPHTSPAPSSAPPSPSGSPSQSQSPSPSPSSPTPSPSAATPTRDPSLPVVLPTLPHPTHPTTHSSSPITPSP
jgi:hypothetical protein